MHHLYNHEYVMLIAGVLLLLLGRKLFWLSVAVIGFVVGAELAPVLLPHQTEIVILAVALFLGIIGALLAIFVQEIAIGIAGFFLGGELSILLSRSLALYNPHYLWIIFIAGGIVGVILMISFFDWGLIILSALAGAHIIMDAIHTTHTIKMVGFVVLAMLGILVQASILRRRTVVAE
jgi:hypothetical protein